MTGRVRVSENPLRFEETKVVDLPGQEGLEPKKRQKMTVSTGVEIPVRYYTDLSTGAVVAFVIQGNVLEIVKMRVVEQAGKPVADRLALKAVLGIDRPSPPGISLSAADITRIENATSLMPKEVK